MTDEAIVISDSEKRVLELLARECAGVQITTSAELFEKAFIAAKTRGDINIYHLFDEACKVGGSKIDRDAFRGDEPGFLTIPQLAKIGILANDYADRLGMRAF